MIELTLGGIFVLYIVVFLAIIFAAWLIFSWRRQQLIHRSLRKVSCKYCGGSIPRHQALVWVRCSHCGARNRLRLEAPTEPSESKNPT
jgi:hypothetical protein